mmetsp:Transcript_26718/g.69404  ORF Transcript_26718/g.69404 Transcript_26718/m.69404 type:complete len:223 (-) Transcript_26718:878-1546(-)
MVEAPPPLEMVEASCKPSNASSRANSASQGPFLESNLSKASTSTPSPPILQMSSPLSSRRSRNASLRPSRQATASTRGATPFADDEHFDRAARHTSRSALPDDARVCRALRAASAFASPRTQDNAFSNSSKAPRTNARPMTSAARSDERPHSFTKDERASFEESTAQARNDAIEAKGAITGFLGRASSIALPAAPVRTEGGSNASTSSSDAPAFATNASLVS